VGELKRLVLTFTREGVEIRTLYRTECGAGPNTKARRREVTDLAGEGLRQALASLEGRVDVVGTSGFTTREDILSLPPSDEPVAARRAAS
jgi:hypothetical protein